MSIIAGFLGILLTLMLLKVFEDHQKMGQLKRGLAEEKEKNRKWMAQYSELLVRKSEETGIPAHTLEAVRYAMIHSHPDNGGKKEEFIVFAGCYNQLKLLQKQGGQNNGKHVF